MRSGKTRTGIETPRLVKEVVCNQVQGDKLAKQPVYLRIDFLNGGKFNPQFDGPELSASEALGARLMKAFYTGVILKKTTHTAALKHIVETVRGNRSDLIVPIVIHFDEHGTFISAWNEHFGDNRGKKIFLSMLGEIGSAATSNEGELRDLHRAGHYFIVPITTGTSRSAATFDEVSGYGIKPVSLPTLDFPLTQELAHICLGLRGSLSQNEIAEIMGDQLFHIAPGLIYYACQSGPHSHVQNLYARTGQYIRSDWDKRWSKTVTVFLARPEVNDGDKLENGYTIRDALDCDTVYRNGKELGLAPALLAKFNENQGVLNPLLLKALSEPERWSWQDFEKSHMLYLAATMAALIEEQKRFSQIKLGTYLRSVQPVDSRWLGCALNLPTTFKRCDYTEQTSQCIPKTNARGGKTHTVPTDDCGQIFLAAEGTPLIDAFLNLLLHRRTTMFIQYKHSGLSSRTSPVHVSTMNQSVTLLGRRLAACGWSEDQEWILFWVTNRAVIHDVTPDDKLLWVDKSVLASHAPLLGRRGLVPHESLRVPDE